ncbi:PASTA domain-containing protein [Microbulbifer sp. SAOS-129_SWC]|uniref:PASTA domain-containing protein n=1 Tax=Microbulbifer sp. SAOS-129_SWC TaxID=3145235 RepID=UPI003217875E
MAKAFSDSILDRLGSDLDDALEQGRAQHEARRVAAQEATARAARWSGFVREPGYADTLAWRSVSLAHAQGTAESAAEELDDTHTTMQRLSAHIDNDTARIFGHVESPTGGGEADLIDADGCMIASSPINTLGYFAIATAATGESARIEIRDAQGQLAVLDGRPLALTPGLMASRDFTTGRCGKVEPVPDQPSERVEMPDLVGKSATDARAILGELGKFRIRYNETHTDNAPAETVIHQEPAPGRSLPAGGAVLLGISLGPEPQQTMPDLIGQTEEAARKALADLHYAAVQFTQVVDRKKAGRVVEQTPDAGAAVGEDSEIRLCMGVAARLMPELVGRTRKQALEILVPDYIDAPTIREEPSDGPAAVVLEQKPKAGEALGDAGVTLVISIERKEDENGLSMPDVIGKARKDALAILRRAGIEEVETQTKAHDGPKGVVIEQRPAAGAKIEDGAVLVLAAASQPQEDVEKLPTMPDVSGKTRAQALKLLEAEGIEEPEFDQDAARRRGARVLKQTPAAGKSVKKGQRVKLVFGKPR